MTPESLLLLNRCVLCKEKLLSFYDFQQTVLENQKHLKTVQLGPVKEEPVVMMSIKVVPVALPKIVEPKPIAPKAIKAKKTERNHPQYQIKVEPSDDDKTVLGGDHLEQVYSKDEPEPEVNVPLPRNSERQCIIVDKANGGKGGSIESFNGVMTCPDCSPPKAFRDFTLLQFHMWTTHGYAPRLTCCNRKFRYKNRLVSHMKSAHEPGQPTTPSEIGYYFQGSGRVTCLSRRAQNQIISRFFILKCHICETGNVKAFENFDQLIQHLKSEHDDNLHLICCDRIYYFVAELASHLLLDHDRPRHPIHYQESSGHTCEECGEQFHHFKIFQSHWLHAHGICKYCNANLMNNKGVEVRAHYQQHVLSSNPEDLAPMVCDLCSVKRTDRINMIKHMKSCHLDKAYSMCDKCGQRFKTPGELKGHQQSSHTEKKPCSICGMLIANWSRGMKAHIETVHKGKPTKCQVCEFVSVSQRASLEHYRRMHTDQGRQHQCQYCDKKLRSKKSKIEHEATHLGMNLYFCTLCPARFKNDSNFSWHKRKKHPKEYEAEKSEKMAKKFKKE